MCSEHFGQAKAAGVESKRDGSGRGSRDGSGRGSTTGEYLQDGLGRRSNPWAWSPGPIRRELLGKDRAYWFGEDSDSGGWLQPNARGRWQCPRGGAPRAHTHDTTGGAPPPLPPSP